ncbi:DUF4129 domain-containing transglutaminase family protein [Aquibacillus salsiterrae]|uniref:TransglutaminaseTgpA domain-containing protein n=1 Tax=Aquibacillus salsiterrae TaxID=2950439 RepID=A0A9X4AGT6_9BACI|nr:transglutaminase domain-containing protein [Aquibacillus salsiterrae]MDC3417473.1 transglutaminaseTgpA domain-containing protein [Aquibacillus salsiterrae]
MERSSPNVTNLYQFIVYLCGFLLFWEWLRPLSIVTDTGNLSLFVMYTAFCFLISILQVKWWLSIPLKLAGLIFVIDGLFISERLFSKAWFYLLYTHGRYNLEVIFQRDFTEMTALFRSFLFLLLLWLMSYLLYYWFVVAKRIFLFVLLTFIYITVLDTFTNYDASIAIVRMFLVSLVAMGITSHLNMVEKESIKEIGFKRLTAWLLPLISIILFSTVIGYAAPKFDPQWPDPVPFIKSTAENAGIGSGGTVVQKVGYGEDDTRLGGSFVQDYEPVFQAAVEQPNYWRIESKDYYTGKGWERSSKEEYVAQEDGRIQFKTFSDNVDTIPLRALVRFDEKAKLPKVVYPYGIDTIFGTGQETYYLDFDTGAIKEENAKLSGYQIEYNYPSFSIDELRGASEEDPEEIKGKYLQLPENLPSRVGELAADVIASDDNRYDKAKAMESYFSLNGYLYQTKGVAVPGRNEDYVDQFLFDTKVGYCDNFSTSMAIMLRTQGIPTRWVKGFTSGEIVDGQPDVPDNLTVYEIRNSNAHSWVEVYFPDIGWVPFEPTKGFSNPVDFTMETAAEPSGQDELTADQEQSPENAAQEEQDIPGKYQDFEDETATASGPLDGQETSGYWKWIITSSLAIIISLILFFTRYRWMSIIMGRRFRHSKNASAYQEAYHFLLKVLAYKGVKRDQDQTLREYAKEVDKRYQTTDMSRLTYHYERQLYRNDVDSTQLNKMTELWENLIKRSLS